MPSVTSKNPQLPVPPTPSDRKVHELRLKSASLMATPPQGPKNDVGEAFSSHSSPLLRLAKVTQKRGFSQRFRAVFQQFCQWSPGGFPAVLPTVLPAVLPVVFRQFSNGFPTVCQRFCQRFAGDAAPWINPSPVPASPFIRKKLSGNSVHTFKPTNPAYGKRKVSAGTWSPGKKRCRQEPNAPGGSSGGPDSRPGCLGGHIPRNVSNRPFWTERCGLCVA